MASQPDSKIPGPGGTAGKEKRRSFLPAPKRSTIPSPTAASAPVHSDSSASPTVKSQNDSPPPAEQPSTVSEAIPEAEHLTVGSRILIGGVKPGILRFVGKTSLAPGLWCGIELFDASGLHDGEVDGKRYFTCKPFRGIFAPLDKVVVDESYQSPVRDEETPPPVSEQEQETKQNEKPVAETVEKQPVVHSEVSKIPAPKSQIARLSGIPRIGLSTQEKGVIKSKSADGIKEATSKIAVFTKRSVSGHDASKVDLNSTTFVRDEKLTSKPRRRSEDADEDSFMNQTYSCNLEKHLKSDSRQYLNITFNKDTPPPSNPTSNLPDVVSSASPSPPRETATRFITGTLNQTQSVQDIATSIASDMSLGLVDPDVIADDTNLLEGVISDRVAAATSESDVSLSGNSSTLEELSVANGSEVAAGGLSSTPLHGVDFKRFLNENGENLSDHLSDADSGGTPTTSIKQNLAQTFTAVSRREELKEDSLQRKDSSSSIGGISAVRADLLQEEGSNGVSPEVSQVLEWDYDHDAFDGKLLLEKCQDGMSTSTSDSCSEASADQGGALAEKIAHDGDIPPADGDEAHLFEESEDGFENIDNIEDFPLGMSKETQHMMTDSGISEKGFLDPAAETASKRKLAEFDSKVNKADDQGENLSDNKASAVDLPEEGRLDQVDVMDLPCKEEVERRMIVDANLQKDLMDGHAKQERPLSLVSTTSGDTGYVPDTDSETGTLTTNSPTDWTERQLNANLAAGSGADPRARAHVSAGKAKHLVVMTKGLPQETLKVADSEKRSDAGSAVADSVSETAGHADEKERAPCNEESEESEDDDEDEESSEEETASEEEEEVADDDRPEDDRIEADRVGPSGDTHSVTHAPTTASDPPVAHAAEVNEAPTLTSDMTESTTVLGTTIVVQTNTTKPVGPAASEDSARGEGPRTSSSDPSPDVSERPDETPGTTTPGGGDGGEADSSRPAPKKKLSPTSSSVDKKTMAEHKKVVKAAHSRLADYIKTPPPAPTKAKEEKGELKKGRVSDVKTNKTVGKKQDNGSSNVAADKSKAVPSVEKIEKKAAPVKEEKPKVKHAAPKSKWGNIMSQIEAGKDTSKPKPKTEVKSSLAVYLSAAPSTSPRKDAEKDDKAKQKEDNLKPKSKLKPIKHSKPDFSNVKSKLNLTSPPKQSSNQRDTSSSSRSSTPKDSNSPRDPGVPKDSTGVFGNVKDSTNPKGPGNPKAGNPKPPGNPRGPGNVEARSSKTMLAKKTSVSRLKTGRLLMDHRETLDNCSTMSQASSRTDLSVQDDVDRSGPTTGQIPVEKKRNTLSCAGSRQKNERSSSVASIRSDASGPQNAVKTKNLRNAQRHEVVSSNVTASKRSVVKSSIPPPTPRTAFTQTKAPLAGPAAARSKSSPPKLTPPPKAKRATSSNNSPAPASRPGANQGLSRNKAGGGLKSGHPPDVVSTSARGSRAQEVARLESLCEARTKELNYTRMQLKAGLQAFDAMTCLLNYCTTQLNAFSCPAITAKLKTAEGKLTEQQEVIERLNQQKAELDQRVGEVTGAKDSAQQEVARLRQEMVQAEEAHTAGEQKLKEEHATALKTLEEDLTSKHQKTVQQMQTCQEKQAEYARQAQKRQVAELTAEHQMFTNQVKLAHLEEIQELRNKHDQQMEELHTQHRNKLEDITRRFESIKLSLSEKVQSLCVECDELRMRAKTSEEALQRDADAKVQLALAPYLHLPKEIESLKMVVDMRTEEIQKLRRHNMDLEKQLEELPIAQEKVASLQQKVENLQAIINIKTDHEKQLHEKCQVLMRKYDKESRANKRLSMDYEQVMWRMSQSADLTGSTESLGARQLSTSPSRNEDHSHTSPCPVRRSLSNISHGGEGGGAHSPAPVARRQRKISGGEDDCDRKIRCRSATFSLDKSKSPRSKTSSGSGMNGSSSSPGSPSKQTHHATSSSEDYADLIVAAINSDHSQSFASSSEPGSADLSDVQPSMKSSVILETSRGVSYNIDVVDNGEADDRPSVVDEVFTTDPSSPLAEKSIPHQPLLPNPEVVESKSEVTVVVNSPTSD